MMRGAPPARSLLHRTRQRAYGVIVFALGWGCLHGQVVHAAPKQKKTKSPLVSEAAREANVRADRSKRQARRQRARHSTAHDAVRVPNTGSPSVHMRHPSYPVSVTGWSATLDQPQFDDRRRRGPASPPVNPWASVLNPGLKFRFELYFGGNPTGTVEASVASRVAATGPAIARGLADTIELRAYASTSGVLGMFATVEEEMTSFVDAESGASVFTSNIVRRSGLMTPYKLRVTDTNFEGRGFARVVDTKDERKRQTASRVPERTLDPLSLIAWVRSLNLQPNERAVAHTLDVTTLLRVDIVSRGRKAPAKIPSLATALGIGSGDLELLEGTMTRVNRFGEPVKGKQPYTFRAWVSADSRRIPVIMETNIWVGTLRLILAGYDPPHTSVNDPAKASEL